LQVHDELDFSISDVNEGKKIQQIMENCVKINVPIKVDLEIGTNWGNVK